MSEQNLSKKSLLKMGTLNADTSELIPKRNHLKFLTLPLPFCLINRKNIQTEWPSLVL